MFELLAPFTVGLLGSLHCLGMCGPLILAWSLHRRTTAPAGAAFPLTVELPHHLLFHFGRITTYAVLGAIAGGLFESLAVQKFSMLHRGVLLIVAGCLTLALALALLRLVPIPAFLVRLFAPGASLGGKMSSWAASDNPVHRAALGLAAGLVPCGLTWAMLVAAAGTMHAVRGLLTMLAFGLGTLPLLLLTGLSASFIGVRMRLAGEKAAAIAVGAMGLLLLARGIALVCGFGDHCGTDSFYLSWIERFTEK